MMHHEGDPLHISGWVDQLVAGQRAIKLGAETEKKIEKVRIKQRKKQIKEDLKFLRKQKIPQVFSRAVQILKRRWTDAHSEVMEPDPKSSAPVGVRLRWNYRVENFKDGIPTWKCNEVAVQIMDYEGERMLKVTGSPTPIPVNPDMLSPQLGFAIIHAPSEPQNVQFPSVVRHTREAAHHLVTVFKGIGVKQKGK